MDVKRIFLIVALSYVAVMLWTAWQKEYPSAKTPVTHAQQSEQSTESAANQTGPTQTDTTKVAAAKRAATKQNTMPAPAQRLVHIKTDVLNVAVDTLGGNIVQVSLPKYPEKLNTPDNPFILLNDKENSLYVAQSGLTGFNGPDTAKSQAKFSTTQKIYELKPGQKQMEVTLNWVSPQGLNVKKIFTFSRDNYEVGVSYTIDNKSKDAWKGHFYTQIKRKEPQKKKNGGLFALHTYTGAAISSPEKRYEKISFKNMSKKAVDQNIKEGWLAMQQHYFLSAWVPQPNQTYQYYSHANDNNVYTIGAIGPEIKVAPGTQLTTKAKFYAGPEDAQRLKQVAPGLDLTIDYGWFWIISTMIFWLMRHIHEVVGNWGWSIVLVTICIRGIFYKLSVISYRSMGRMRQLQPKIASIKERYGDDKQKFSQATMELYKKEKVNPLSGCLPILIQIPVFIGLYWVLIESVQLRQAPFIFWIHDLSVKDPYYVLPLLMGLTMFLQQKMSPPPPDPMQAKVMMALPVIFTVFFLAFPAGLVLYWVTNNTFSITQQWYIMHKLEKEQAQGKSNNNKKGRRKLKKS